MQLAKGDMFVEAQAPCVTLVTANATIRRDGALVMGRGAALRLKELEPWVPYVAGAMIYNSPDESGLPEYGVLFLPNNWGLFQVKYHFKSKADIGLIVESSLHLRDIARAAPDMIFNLNFPGIGNGGLSREEVLPKIREILPNNVLVWEN